MTQEPLSSGRHAGRVAIVTGAGSGIGRAVAELLLREGGTVVAADLSDDRLGWCRGTERVVPASVDVADAGANDALVSLAVDTFGGLDAVVLNAGIAMSGSIETLPIEEFERAVDVNVKAVALGIRASAPALRERGGGSIAITASTSGQRGDPGMWAYNATKAAVINLARSAALDLGAEDIRVNVVCPGPTHTGMTERLQELPAAYEALRRRTARQQWATADEVAAVFGFLVSAESGAVTGAVINADGGISANTGQFLPPERSA
ncbi:SDR family NAD(P)-dependent oxidoreductase [Ilumatobacter nonamiensis]|uniref:SDR family NAD(P)-dependent oxidoreductase n=1 Tax=Ilumatobacter nonamiensis TaxID=467093 RepID=UPI00034DE8D3|nr:SDR family oxidoreductase [Ilumatobacter nonamiensis]